jgi:nitrate/nitrite transporter NarK
MQSLLQYYVFISIMGLAVTGLGDITVGAAVSEWFTRNRGLALGIVYTGSNLGGFVLTRVANAIAVESTWREALLTIGVLGALLILPFAWFAVRAPRGAERPEIEAGEGADSSADLPLRAAVRTRSFWLLAGSLFTFFFYFLGMLEHLVLFLRGEGLSREQATAYFSYAIGLGIGSKLLGGWLADRLPRRATLLIDFGLLAFSSVVLLALPHAWLIWVFVISYSFATAARDVVYPLIIQYSFGVRYMASVYGAMMVALLPGGALGPLFAGAIHDRTGSYDAAFATYALLNTLAFAALFWVRDERRASGSAI